MEICVFRACNNNKDPYQSTKAEEFMRAIFFIWLYSVVCKHSDSENTDHIVYAQADTGLRCLYMTETNVSTLRIHLFE